MTTPPESRVYVFRPTPTLTRSKMAIYMKPAQAENYIACPWNSYLELFCGYKSPFAQENLLGGASHTFIAGLHKQKSEKISLIRPTARFNADHLFAEWQGLWMDHIAAAKYGLDGHAMDFFEDGRTRGFEYVKKYLSISGALKLSEEKIDYKFPVTRVPTTSVHLDVSVDQIRTEKSPPFGDILIDLKMSQWNQYNPAENLKLLCYALVYREFYGQLPSQVGIWNVPFAKEGMFFTKVTDEMLTKAINTLGIMGRNIRQRKWNVPDGKRVCNGCRTKEMCSRPADSPTLKRLAFRNTEFKGHLPLTRSEIIAERILEKPIGKSIPEIVEQGELTFDSTMPSKMS